MIVLLRPRGGPRDRRVGTGHALAEGLVAAIGRADRSSDASATYIKSETENWSRQIKAAGIQFE